MSKLSTFIYIILLTCLTSELALAQVIYHVAITEDTPEQADVSMIISGRARARVLYSRSGDLQTKTQVSNVSCAGKAIRQNNNKEWNIPRNCKQVNWQVDFVSEDEQGIAAYEQKSVLMSSGKWWVFSSPSALLRLKREPSDLKIKFDVPFQKNFEAKLPLKSRPPEYFALGDVKKQTVRRTGIKLTYISDNPSYTSQFVDVDDQAQALEYLSAIMGMDEGEVLDTTMIMLGIKRERGELGGTAGENAMLVNYIYENENSQTKEKYFPILIAIHEQIHQIYRGTSHLTWVSESLAHYYASKAMLRVYPDNQAVREITEDLYNSKVADTPGLVEIQRRLDENRDFSNYQNFYEQGSAFWYKLDQLIQLHSGDRETLDDYLAVIMRTEFYKNKGLPKKLRRYLSFIDDAELETLENQYLLKMLK